MGLKISSSGLFTRTWLKVTSEGILFMDAAAFSSKHRFRFNEIDCILLSPDSTKLSFQARNKVFSIPVNPNNAKHQTTIATLLSEVKRAGESWGPT